MKKLLAFMGIFCLVLPLVFLGCEGDTGPQGPAGQNGTTTTIIDVAVAPESCVVCHNDQAFRNGDSHQADYNQRFQDNVVVIVPGSITYAYSAVDNTHTVMFEMTKKDAQGVPQDFDCTSLSYTGTTNPSALSIIFTEYTAANRSFDPPTGFVGERLSLGSQGSSSSPSTLTYDAATNICTSVVDAGAEGDLSALNGLIVFVGRDDRLGTLPSPSRVQLALYPFAGLMETGTVDYVSAATVTGCERCHTIPYLKHGYEYGRVDHDPATDFYTCKGCHADNGEGGHFIWQVLVDDPQLSGDLYAQWVAEGKPNKDLEEYMTPAEQAQYAYRTRLMNDVHMSHAMEFAYPMSMANCIACHEGKLNMILTDANFTAETCKSCHPVNGGTDAPNGVDSQGNPIYAVDTINDPAQAPPLTKIWADKGVAAFHNATLTCNMAGCHIAGAGAATFSDVHTGYDKVIYGDTAAGTKYSADITVSIDTASFNDNTKILSFSFSATGSLGTGGAAADSANIVPTVLVGLYGYTTKDYIQGPHESDPLGHENTAPSPSTLRALEYTVGANPTTGRNSPYIQVSGGAVTVDLSQVPDWANWIDNGTVTRVELAVLPDLENADGVQVALNAPSRTFNLTTNAFEDSFFGNSIVKVTNGCNTCHDALATTFHSPDRGGNVVVCRLCHITKSPGSHLELQSRSIDSYTHAIHRFQVFDIGDIDFTDPVEALHFEHHVNSNFPRFGIEDCQSCHNAGRFNVPDQSKSMPGALSSADLVPVRDIGDVPPYVTGPATRACGACHRAEAIIANDGEGDANMLTSINAHMKTNGYLIDSTGKNVADLVVEITDTIFSIL